MNVDSWTAKNRGILEGNEKNTHILLQNFGVLYRLYALGFYKFCRLDFDGIFSLNKTIISDILLVYHVNLLPTVNMVSLSCDTGEVYLNSMYDYI